jgi:hypothetical protein
VAEGAMMDVIQKANAFEACKSEGGAKICSHQLFSNKFRKGGLKYSVSKKYIWYSKV